MSSNTNCCAPNCHSRKAKNPELSFHCFPKEKEKRKAWQAALKIGKPISDVMKVCARHFSQQDFFFISERTKRPRLKLGVVPTQNLPLSSVEDPVKVEKKNVSAQEREERYKEITRKKTEFEGMQNEALSKKPRLTEDHEEEDPGDHEEEDDGDDEEEDNDEEEDDEDDEEEDDNEEEDDEDDEEEDDEDDEEEDDEDEVCAAGALLLIKQEVGGILSSCIGGKADASMQVSTSEIISTRFPFYLTDEKINSLTGLPSVRLLDVIVSHLNMLEVEQRQISLKDQVLLVLMKIKLNLRFVALGPLFHVSSATCKSIFSSIIAKLAALLKACIPWPTRDEIEKNRPKVFEKLQSVRTIVGCTEIPISKFKCLQCNRNAYSHHYGKQTVKYMFGISPGGLATYISKGYGGGASDSAILVQSELLKMLEPHVDSVLMDKGFLIPDRCAEHCMSIVWPPFLKSMKLPAEEYPESIAGARVHVERFIQHVKSFKILHSGLSCNMLPYIDQILTVVTGIANLRNPI